MRQYSYFIKENHLDDKLCDYLIDFFERNNENVREHLKFLSLNLIQYRDTVIDQITLDNKKISNDFYHEKLKIANVEISKYPLGTDMDWHKDIVTDSRVQYRLTSICYLNDDFDGGEIMINDHIKIKPKKGLLIIFDGLHNFHKVNMVEKKPRYNMLTWYN